MTAHVLEPTDERSLHCSSCNGRYDVDMWGVVFGYTGNESRECPGQPRWHGGRDGSYNPECDCLDCG